MSRESALCIISELFYVLSSFASYVSFSCLMIPWNWLQGRGGLSWAIVVVQDHSQIDGLEGVELKAQRAYIVYV